ncbi:hypothetical protein MVES1_002937 [Malassezia vespertilionis]|uniref:uncharacterized protein n=1 Tax=Malassezia vespertilionis TaxID=2020962 RepID=UPI0024B082C2|nr:uncharacterized protein MVES1_002937 [Malassezia vespertilionis]WFD07570.1 hypothetical protein MVES1_002937 [Malassezia vespertilionis]
MAQILTATGSTFAKKYVDNFSKRFEPEDPYYETYEHNGKQKRRKRPLPQGLTRKEEKILRKVLRRAHYLDKGFNICGMRFGWTFLIGLIPLAGDLVDALLNYNLIIKKCKQVDKYVMLANNSVSIGLGLVPIVGDIDMRERAAENLRNQASGTNAGTPAVPPRPAGGKSSLMQPMSY